MSTLTEYQALIGDRSQLAGGIDGLAYAIADDAARSDVELFGICVHSDPTLTWDVLTVRPATSGSDDDPVWEQRMAQRAAVYLYVRGLLELVPGHPGWVRITPNPKDATHGR